MDLYSSSIYPFFSRAQDLWSQQTKTFNAESLQGGSKINYARTEDSTLQAERLQHTHQQYSDFLDLEHVEKL